MEPVEINAGEWYLRAIRHDGWAADTAYSWAVCEPTTGESVAEIVLDPARATLDVRADDTHTGAAAAAERSVRRFAEAALGLGELLLANSFHAERCAAGHPPDCS